MARRGLQAYAVPSAQAGQRTDPSARRDSLPRIVTAGFLVLVVLSAIVIIAATPEFAEPAVGGDEAVVDVVPSASPELRIVDPEAPTSRPPERLKGYRWPLRGGAVVRYYDWDERGFLLIDEERAHTGLAISWFKGAYVKAAHKGKVVAAGRDWATQVGFEAPVDDVVARLRKKKGPGRPPVGVVIDDGNGYHSVITGLKELTVEVRDKVKAGSIIGRMADDCCIRYELVRMDGTWMRVADRFVRRDDYPLYTRERVDPLLVLDPSAKKAPRLRKPGPPKEPPRVELP